MYKLLIRKTVFFACALVDNVICSAKKLMYLFRLLNITEIRVRLSLYYVWPNFVNKSRNSVSNEYIQFVFVLKRLYI